MRRHPQAERRPRVIAIRSTITDTGARSFLVRLTGAVTNRRDLNEALALRLSAELKTHFLRKNAMPNKMGAPKTDFWNQMAAATGVLEITSDGATVTVAERRFKIQLFGGTILPKKARALTIPLVAEARGRFVKDYERDTGRHLFSIPGRNALFEKTANATESLVAGTKGRVRGTNRSFSVGLAARTGIRAVYALAKSARIQKDPDALPPMTVLAAALAQEADDFMRTINPTTA